jgi:hypothetical protein
MAKLPAPPPDDGRWSGGDQVCLTLGGIAILGINRVVIGSVIAAMFIAAWGMFSASRSAHSAVRTDSELQARADVALAGKRTT